MAKAPNHLRSTTEVTSNTSAKAPMTTFTRWSRFTLRVWWNVLAIRSWRIHLRCRLPLCDSS